MKRKIRMFILIIACQLLMAAAAFAAGPWQPVTTLPAKDAEVTLGDSLALAVDPGRQRYYVVDSDRAQLVSFDAQGAFLAALNPGNQLVKPVSLALAANGKLWIVERATNQLLYVDLQQQQVRAFDLTYPDGGLIFPDQVALDTDNRLFLLDRARGGVVRLDDNLQVVQTYLPEGDFQGFADFQITAEGVWALDGLSRTLHLFAVDGSPQRRVSVQDLQFPVALAIDAVGQFYLLDRHAGKVAVFDRQGGFSYDFLLKGKRPGRLWYPSGLLFDWDGRLCVANEGNGRIDIYAR